MFRKRCGLPSTKMRADPLIDSFFGFFNGEIAIGLVF